MYSKTRIEYRPENRIGYRIKKMEYKRNRYDATRNRKQNRTGIESRIEIKSKIKQKIELT